MSLPGIVREYGQAMRGDWSDIDGRAVQCDMDEIAGWVSDPKTYPGAARARIILGLCPHGLGCWEHWCADLCRRDES